MSRSIANIPLMRPRLPDASALAPYLAEIDANRWYSNFGPLERRFEARLAAHFELGDRQVVCVANGTQALTISLRSRARFPVGYCVMPSFTFAATPHAAVSAGLEPYFVDVGHEDWCLDPQQLRSVIAEIDMPVAAVVPVAPFGAPIDVAAWENFEADTGIPVVIDAAAGFDCATAAEFPTILSLHATKVFGIGEGGLVLCRNERTVEHVRAGRNFGFFQNRSAEIHGVNAKLSEYGAAVGMAAMDHWPETRRGFTDVAARYVEVFADMDAVRFAPGFSSEIATSTCNILLNSPIAAEIIGVLAGEGIDARQWWNRGCHNEPVFDGCGRTALPVTEFLADRVLGLPFYLDLTIEEISRIRDCLTRALTR